MTKRMLAAVLACALILAAAASFTGCGKKAEEPEPAVFIGLLDHGVTANFDNKTKGEGGGSGISVEEGEYLIIDNKLTKGSVHVTVSSGGDSIESAPTEEEAVPATIDYVFDSEGGVTEYREIEPGSYMVFFTVEEKTAGSIDVYTKAAE